MGIDLNNHIAKVAWDELCVPKEERGLGLMTSKEWNKAAIAKRLWKHAQPNSNSIWVN